MNEHLDSMPCGYVSFNDQGTITGMNRTLGEWLQYSEKDLQGKKFENLTNIAGRIFFQTHFFPMLKMQNKAEEIFFSLLTRNGVTIPVLANSKKVEAQGETRYQCVFLPIHNRRVYEDELLTARKTAEKALEENSEIRKSREEAQQHAVVLDEKLSHINQIHRELLQVNEILNHDMQECIRKVLLYARLASEEKDLSHLDKVVGEGKRLKWINSTLETFINLGLNNDEHKVADLNQILDTVVKGLHESERKAHFSVEFAELPVIRGSAWQLEFLFRQILQNVIIHSGLEQPVIKLSAEKFEENRFRNLAGKYEFREVIRLTFSDEGKGIDACDITRIFDLLKKKDGEPSLGSGLALCRKVVDNHYGDISIQSEPGKGTRVKIILPVAG